MTADERTVHAFYDAALNRKDFDAAVQYLGDRYIQHNPTSADLKEGLRAFIEYLRANLPDYESCIVRTFSDEDYVIPANDNRML